MESQDTIPEKEVPFSACFWDCNPVLLNVQCMATVVSCILSSVLVVYSERDSSLIVNLSWPETQVCGRALKKQNKNFIEL